MDPLALREEVKSKYRAVAVDPRASYHFHTGRPLARRLGYDESICRQPAHGRPPAIQSAHKSILRSPPAGISLPLNDVGKLQTPTRFQCAHHFGEDPPLVGAEIDDAVADHDIGRAVFDK